MPWLQHLFQQPEIVDEVHPWYTQKGFHALIESIQVHLPERERVLWIIGTSVIAILVLIVIQLRAFGRPPPVPPKELPKRPVLQILFKPDDISNARNGNETKVVTTLLSRQSSNDNNAFPSATSSTAQSNRNSIRQETGWRHRFRTSMGSFPNMMFGRQASAATLPRRNVSGGVETVAEDEDEPNSKGSASSSPTSRLLPFFMDRLTPTSASSSSFQTSFSSWCPAWPILFLRTGESSNPLF